MPDPLNPLGRPGTAPVSRARPRAGSEIAFEVPSAEAPAAAAPEATAAGSIGAVNPMLLHELAVDDGERRDREAHRRASDILDLLAELQRGLLGANVEGMPIDRLTSLLENAPAPADPVLAAATQSILLRARIEIARRLPRAPAQD